MSMSTLALIDFGPIEDASKETTSSPLVRSKTVSTDVLRLITPISQHKASLEHETAVSDAEGSEAKVLPSPSAIGSRLGARARSEPVAAHLTVSSDAEPPLEAQAEVTEHGGKATASGNVEDVRLEPKIEKRTMPLTKDARHFWIAHLSLTPLTEIDQLICDGRLEEAIVLVKTGEKTSIGQSADDAATLSKAPDKMHTKSISTEITPLHLAALFGDLEVAQALVAAGADAFALASVFRPDPLTSSSRPTALAFAIGGRHPEMVKFLIATMRKRIGAMKTFTFTSLLDRRWLRVTDCRYPGEINHILQIFHEYGLLENITWAATDVAEKFICRETFLHQACQITGERSQLRAPVVSFLMKARMNVMATTVYYRKSFNRHIPLHHAIDNDAAEVVPLLLQRHCSEQLNKGVGTSGDSVHLAVSRAASNAAIPLDVVERLLEAGANVHHETAYASLRKAFLNRTSTPLSIAQASGRKDLEQLVSKYGNKFDYKRQRKYISYQKDADLWIHSSC
ncbi:hypothetical protein LTR09_009570 [Extremus antarcticus]|uniref:Uncharacterized protein n=1 Tax=Extremus antarcticus TaxID=702011 RepID=A0AAJ0G5L3_9PEZI|nr:hypothetical protein LTR09_009570 [Extremus antarcticus]